MSAVIPAATSVPVTGHALYDLLGTLLVLICFLVFLRVIKSAEDVVEKAEDIKHKWDADRPDHHRRDAEAQRTDHKIQTEAARTAAKRIHKK